MCTWYLFFLLFKQIPLWYQVTYLEKSHSEDIKSFHTAVRITYILYRNTDILLNYSVVTNLKTPKNDTQSVLQTGVQLSPNIFSLKMLNAIRRTGHILNILD